MFSTDGRRSNQIKSNLARLWKSRPNWLLSTAGYATKVRLTHENIYIFPNLAGFGYLSVCLLLWVIAVNYQNNLIYILLFVLLSVFVVTILHSFANLRGLAFTVKGEVVAQAGSQAQAVISVGAGQFRDIKIWVKGSVPLLINGAKVSDQLSLTFPMPVRGVSKLPVVKVSSSFPLGIFTTWANLRLDLPVYSYPIALPCQRPLAHDAKGKDSDDDHAQLRDLIVRQQGEPSTTQLPSAGALSNDINGFRDYVTSDKLSHINWSAYARGAGLNVATFEFEGLTKAPLPAWLRYVDFARQYESVGHEEILSYLCYWVQQSQQQGEFVTLALENDDPIDITDEDKTLQTALKALAHA